MSLSTPELAREYSRAWASREVAAIVALHTEDSVFHVHGLTEPAIGRPAIAAAVTAMFGQAPDLRFEPVRLHLGADHIASEYVMSGTAGSSAFACDGADVIVVSDGLVQRKDTYLDLAAPSVKDALAADS
jgi:ketosteroid isomerase-like protein